MYEIFPLLAGVAVALGVQRLVAPRLQLVSLVGLSVVFGFIASLISGELSVSWAYLIFDTGLVLLSAVVTTVLILWWQRRSARLL